MAFKEDVRFPETISAGASGGPEFATITSVNDGGHEQRNARWAYPLHRYDVSHGLKDQAGLDILKAFFMTVFGMLTAFRYKDWADYSVTQAQSSAIQSFGGVFQLGKTYTSGAASMTRTLKKIVDNTYTIYRDAVLQTEGPGAGEYAIDITTGIVTFQPDASSSITGITQANPGVITDVAHGRTTGDELELSAIGGMTELNGQTVTITVLTADTFSIGVDTSAYTAYTSGGAWNMFLQSTEALTWAGEFDVPCRFDTDVQNVTIASFNNFGWGSISVAEIRPE